MAFEHYSVLLNETIDNLCIKPDGIYVDGTLGGAGHSSVIASRLTTGRLIGIDRDEVALTAAAERLAPYMDRVTLLHGNFGDIKHLLESIGVERVDGMVFDLGVSSPQLDDGERGFSYMADAPLDMRMDRSESFTAWNIVNEWSREELRRILFEYGEERYAPAIAAAIERERQNKPISTTLELVDVIKSAMPGKALREKQHPAKRSFQAIRIAVNQELKAVEDMLACCDDLLEEGGRICVITFHSLEDRLVKRAFQEKVRGCTCPPDFPVCVCGNSPTMKIITKKPITAGEDELSANPRSRSAKLRVAQKV